MSILAAVTTVKEELKAYFHHLDGSKDWENRVKHAVERLYHEDMVVVTAEGEKDRETMVKFVKDFTLKGGKAQDMKIEDMEAETSVRYRGVLVHGDGHMSRIDSIGIYKDGQLIRIEPSDPTVYSKLLKNH